MSEHFLRGLLRHAIARGKGGMRFSKLMGMDNVTGRIAVLDFRPFQIGPKSFVMGENTEKDF
ncbi:MAG: hypothetical protein PHQ04_05615 [Opitutaceae bacterium]|nr:hypothetical protein [Opitutaceae bacterium]